MTIEYLKKDCKDIIKYGFDKEKYELILHLIEYFEKKQEEDVHRRTVSFDSYDITVRQLIDMTAEKSIDIAPEYQRHFIWDPIRQSALIESLLLGIPIPSLFMATNKDSTWEVIDGLQRLTTIINFCGSNDLIKQTNPNCKKLKLSGLEKLTALNGLTYETLPKSLQLMFYTRPLRITVLNDRSDFEIRYELFERLNTGGVTLHPQEIRNCIFLGRFNDFLKNLAINKSFLKVVKMTEKAKRTGNFEELVLKFFAYMQDRDNFVHSVKEFLNDYMEKKTKNFKDEEKLTKIFLITFKYLENNLPQGIVRGNRTNITPVVLYEAISIGVAELLDNEKSINNKRLVELLDDKKLNKLTTGATNSKNKIFERIEYVKNEIVK